MERIYKKYEDMKILSGSALKIIAVISMIIDHTTSCLLVYTHFANVPIITIAGHSITLLFILRRVVGRIAFPIYCFLITEGYKYTHDKFKYGRNLLIFAFISEIPWNLEHTGKLITRQLGQNIYFTLFFGYLAICIYEKYKDDKYKQFTYLALLFAAVYVVNGNYNFAGFGFILILYILRERKIVQAIAGSCVMGRWAWSYLLAFIPINMYNGERGFIKGKAAKYAFYLIYPLHIFILYLIRLNTFGYN